MAIPDYETLMLPILQFLADGVSRKTSEIVSHISDLFDLTEEERKQLIPSGRANLINNRVGWACTYLRKAGLISSQQRGWNQITENGQAVVGENPGKVDNTYLSRFEAFQEFRTNSVAQSEGSSDSVVSQHDAKTPEEIIGLQNELINYNISRDLMDLVISMEPDAFEQMVVDLLIAMGYGGSVKDAGRAIGKAGDGGIDGIINEDVLGLETIYIQAKRWTNAVPIDKVRDFAGALLSKQSKKGVFITTSSFPSSAYAFASSIDRKLVLIDGEMLAGFMIQYNLGVSVKQTVEIKEIDSDYFAV